MSKENFNFKSIFLELFRKPIKGILKKRHIPPQWVNYEGDIIAIPDRNILDRIVS